MNTLKIKKEDSVKAYKSADKEHRKLLEDLFGKDTFKSCLKITERIKTFDDVLSDNGIDKISFDNSVTTLSEDETAYRMIKLICKTLNEGWEPDWDDSNECKYYPWFNMRSSGFSYDGCAYWNSRSDVGSRLVFKSSKLAEYAGKQFTEIYKSFMTN